jgi:hypothetical protein
MNMLKTTAVAIAGRIVRIASFKGVCFDLSTAAI